MERRSTPARWLAPLALLAALAAILFVVSSTDGGDGGGDTSGSSGITASETTDEPASTTSTETTPSSGGPKRYEVKPGDTLTAIADATGVPLEQIEELNPGIDSQSLTVGQRIRIRP